MLVAAAVLAIGLLGQLALLVQGLRTERAAANLATAATLAADLGERIRANPGAALQYAVDTDGVPQPSTPCAPATPYDAAVRAACDLDEWLHEAAAALPGMTAQVVTSVAVAGESATLSTITVRWQTQSAGTDEYTLQVQARAPQ